MKVKLNSPWRGHTRNETIDVPDKVGKSLIRLATAVLVSPLRIVKTPQKLGTVKCSKGKKAIARVASRKR